MFAADSVPGGILQQVVLVFCEHAQMIGVVSITVVMLDEECCLVRGNAADGSLKEISTRNFNLVSTPFDSKLEFGARTIVRVVHVPVFYGTAKRHGRVHLGYGSITPPLHEVLAQISTLSNCIITFGTSFLVPPPPAKLTKSDSGNRV